MEAAKRSASALSCEACSCSVQPACGGVEGMGARGGGTASFTVLARAGSRASAGAVRVATGVWGTVPFGAGGGAGATAATTSGEGFGSSATGAGLGGSAAASAGFGSGGFGAAGGLGGSAAASAGFGSGGFGAAGLGGSGAAFSVSVFWKVSGGSSFTFCIAAAF